MCEQAETDTDTISYKREGQVNLFIFQTPQTKTTFKTSTKMLPVYKPYNHIESNSKCSKFTISLRRLVKMPESFIYKQYLICVRT